MWVTEHLLVPSVAYSFFLSPGVYWGPTTVWLPAFKKKISSFVFSTRKKLIQVWNNIRVSKKMKKKILVNYPFNYKLQYLPLSLLDQHATSL